MDQTTVLLIILGMALATYLPRALPLWTLASRSLSPAIVAWLRFVPASVLAALLAPTLLLDHGQPNLGLDNLFLWASLPVFVLAWRTRSLFGSVLLGMALVAAGRYFLAD